MLSWGPFEPDVGGPNSGRAQLAEGVIAQAAAEGIGYGPYPKLVTADGAESLSAAPRGGIALQTFSGDWKQYYATETTIEELQSDYTWSDVETGRTVTAGDDVCFWHYGRVLLNTDTTSGVKAYDVESGGTNDPVTDAPAARFGFACNNVNFLLDCDGDNRRMESSDLGSYTVWFGGTSDGKTFQDGGALICGGDLKNGQGIILQERALTLIQFGAGASAYSLPKIADGRGCIGARTFVAFDGTAYWWDTDGPWSYSAGGVPTPIGAEKINRWAKETIGPENYINLQASVDPARNLVVWRIDASTVLVYNWLLKAWSTLPVQSAAISRLATAAISIDSVADEIDGVSDPIDSPIWSGTAPQLGGLDTNNRFATFTGVNMAARLKSCAITGPKSKRYIRATPVSDATLSTLAIGTSDSLPTALSFGTASVRDEYGEVPFDDRGKHYALEETIPEGDEWTYTNGVDNLIANEG